MRTEQPHLGPPNQVRASWKDRLRDRWETLKAERASPAGIGVSVAVGVTIGCTPLYGLQTVVALATAWLCRLNKIAVLLGSGISIPITAPFLLFAAAQIGEFLRKGHWLSITLSALRTTPFRDLGPDLAADLFLGGLLEGATLGAALGSVVGYLVWRHRASVRAP